MTAHEPPHLARALLDVERQLVEERERRERAEAERAEAVRMGAAGLARYRERAEQAEAERDALRVKVALIRQAAEQAMADDDFARNHLRGVLWVLASEQELTPDDIKRAHEIEATLRGPAAALRRAGEGA